jgi:hypothetical protein
VPSLARLPRTHQSRDEILARHRAALERGEPSYVDPETGFVVLTASFLADRGTCCESGCRHCPYVD